jgi:hypothetical protein
MTAADNDRLAHLRQAAGKRFEELIDEVLTGAYFVMEEPHPVSVDARHVYHLLDALWGGLLSSDARNSAFTRFVDRHAINKRPILSLLGIPAQLKTVTPSTLTESGPEQDEQWLTTGNFTDVINWAGRDEARLRAVAVPSGHSRPVLMRAARSHAIRPFPMPSPPAVSSRALAGKCPYQSQRDPRRSMALKSRSM